MLQKKKNKLSGNRMVSNSIWIIGGQVFQMGLTLVVGMLTARYLGPSNYGVINYAASVVAFFLPIMQLGLTSTLVQEMITCPNKEGEILGTSLVLNFSSGVVCVVGVTLFAFLANAKDAETTIVCFLYSLTLIFQAAEMIQYWFQARLLSKYPSLMSLVAYLIVSIYKVYILISEKGIYWFAITHVIESFIISVLLGVVYLKLEGPRLAVSFSLGKKLLSRSKYYISSAMMVIIFQQTDKIMLKMMIDETETGFYSAAITCIGITGFVFVAIIDSFRPVILRGKKISEDNYQKKVVYLYAIITILSLIQSIVMTVFAKLVILILFGEEFLPSVPILQIAVWFVTFGYYGMVRNVWILAEGQQKYLWFINLVGALTNIIVNFILIPILGACGAAIASVITQFITNFALCFIIKPIRPCGRLILKALNPKIFSELISIIKERK